MSIYSEYLDLARIALSGRTDDVLTLLRRHARRKNDERPEFKTQLNYLLRNTLPDKSHLRLYPSGKPNGQSNSLYLDTQEFTTDPVWPDSLARTLEEIVAEREKIDELRAARINPTQSLLLVGPPGVGKTLAARWLAKKLQRQLYVVNLATLMSSRLGETGSNLTYALGSGANSSSILLLDEFDSVGKKRNDDHDVGELKRLVNVLLQAMDRWPTDGLLIAATNHPELLDYAVWRRFDRIVTFPKPDVKALQKYCVARLEASGFNVPTKLAHTVAVAFNGQSFADLENVLKSSMRKAIIHSSTLDETLALEAATQLANKSTDEKVCAALGLIGSGLSQREAARLLSISRDTIRKHKTS